MDITQGRCGLVLLNDQLLGVGNFPPLASYGCNWQGACDSTTYKHRDTEFLEGSLLLNYTFGIVWSVIIVQTLIFATELDMSFESTVDVT